MREPASNVVSTGIGLDAQQAELADRTQRLAPNEGPQPSGLPGLTLIRFDRPTAIMASVYEPAICVVVQGRKETTLAGERYVYDPLHYLLVSMSLPVLGRVIEATPDKPHLCLRIDVDTQLIAELLLQLGSDRVPAPAVGRALMLARSSAPLLDAVLRLLRLRDTPDEAAILAPLALREIHYRVLVGELGPRLRALCEADGQAQRVARAIGLLRTRYTETLRIEELAEAANMSVSSLHHRFKAVTNMSPLQFQKQLRLQEARRLMLGAGLDAAAAAYRVGYESASQFSREYRRLFGAPPREEVNAVRAAAGSLRG